MHVKSVRYVLMIEDMDRALSFYETIFGFAVRTKSPHWSELSHGGAIIALHSGGSSKRRPTGLSIEVSNVDAACDRVEDMGGEIVKRPEARAGEGITLATFADVEGNEITLLAQQA